MTQNPVVLSPSNSIRECAEEMDKHHVGTVIIKENGKAVGVISEQDIVRKIIAKKLDPHKMKVEDIMEKEIVTINPDADIFDALDKMKGLNVTHLPVVDDGNLLGLLTVKDILKIEPQLFDILVEKFELREEERKPINRIGKSEGICHLCGEYAEELIPKDKVFMCAACNQL